MMTDNPIELGSKTKNILDRSDPKSRISTLYKVFIDACKQNPKYLNLECVQEIITSMNQVETLKSHDIREHYVMGKIPILIIEARKEFKE